MQYLVRECLCSQIGLNNVISEMAENGWIFVQAIPMPPIDGIAGRLLVVFSES